MSHPCAKRDGDLDLPRRCVVSVTTASVVKTGLLHRRKNVEQAL